MSEIVTPAILGEIFTSLEANASWTSSDVNTAEICGGSWLSVLASKVRNGVCHHRSVVRHSGVQG